MKKKSILILKATKDICGNEIGLIQNHCELLKMNTTVEHIDSEAGLNKIIEKLATQNKSFDFIYLCTHGDKEGFLANMGDAEHNISWAKFGQILCESWIINDDSILLLACCKGGLFQVTTDILSVCNKINFVCGVKWNVAAWDLTTGFVVFLHNIINKDAEPSYAAQKASLATDYTFVCYDRDEIEMHPQYLQRQGDLFYFLGWTDKEGNWIVRNQKIIENVGHLVVENLIKK
jgi:hypothetical protein